MHLYARVIDLASFYAIGIEFWNCFDSVVCYVVYFVIVSSLFKAILNLLTPVIKSLVVFIFFTNMKTCLVMFVKYLLNVDILDYSDTPSKNKINKNKYGQM